MTSQFTDFGLSPEIMSALSDAGYENPTPIQNDTIPPLMEGRDVIGQAQTGTGKTAAFALPFLSKIDAEQRSPQLLVLAPTRELAMQVAQSFQTYSKNIRRLMVTCIYGGQSYTPQLSALKRGPQVIVGTPGRIMDHIKKGTLSLADVQFLVLDEADEMLRMGFQEDVEWILKHITGPRQTALFSATMPGGIRRIAQTYLNKPVEITHSFKLKAADTIEQQYWVVKGLSKFEAFRRILETEQTDGTIVFVRTRAGTVKLAEDLEAKGYSAAPLNGDLSQKQREYTVKRFKQGHIDVLVATDVAARGLHVERCSHVINYDMPFDHETYVHRVGRTGRAGQSGKAILFVMPNERRLLARLERSTGKKIDVYWVPDVHKMQAIRQDHFKNKLKEVIEKTDLAQTTEFLTKFQTESDLPWEQIATALALMPSVSGQLFAPSTKLQRDRASLAKPPSSRDDYGNPRRDSRRDDSKYNSSRRDDSKYNSSSRDSKRDTYDNSRRDSKRDDARSSRDAEYNEAPSRRERAPKLSFGPVDKGMERFRLALGKEQGVSPKQIQDSIVEALDLHPSYVGTIELFPDHSTVDLPEGLPRALLRRLKRATIADLALDAQRLKTMDSLKKIKGKDSFSSSYKDKKFGGKKKKSKGKGKGKGRTVEFKGLKPASKRNTRRG